MYRRMTGLETYGAALCRAGVLAVTLLLQVGVASAEVIDGEELKDPTRPMGAVGGQGEGFLTGLQGSTEGLLNQIYTVSFIRAGGNNTTTNASASLQQFFSGISMDITPQISADGMITLHVHSTISTVVEQSKTIAGEQVPLARTSVRELDSVIRGEDGKIVVLGGLAYERSVDDLAGVPVVNDIPVVGAAFDQRRRQTVKSEFIILLRPMIANDESDKSFIRESSDRFEQLNQDIRRAF